MDSAVWRAEASRQVKGLFGRPVRVLLAIWILQNEQPFFLQEAQTALLPFGEAPSAVAKELRVLVEHGMLSEMPDGRRVYFTPITSPLWDGFLAIGTAVNLVPVEGTLKVNPEPEVSW